MTNSQLIPKGSWFKSGGGDLTFLYPFQVQFGFLRAILCAQWFFFLMLTKDKNRRIRLVYLGVALIFLAAGSWRQEGYWYIFALLMVILVFIQRLIGKNG